jgi:hypothetical protein
MGLNDNMFDDPLENGEDTTDPVVTPVQAQKGSDATFQFGKTELPSKEAKVLTPEAIQEIAAGSLQLKAFEASDAKSKDIQEEQNRVIADNSVSRIQVKAAVEGFDLVLPDYMAMSTFTVNASRTHVEKYKALLAKRISAEAHTSIAIVHQMFGEPIDKALSATQHILSQHIGTLQSVISQMSADVQSYQSYCKETKNVIFVRSSPKDKDDTFVNVIESSLSEFSFSEINYDFNKKQLAQHVQGLDDVFKTRSMRVLLNLFLNNGKLCEVFHYKRMADDPVVLAPSLKQLMDFSTSTELMTLPQSMSEVCTANQNKLLELQSSYVKLRANDDELLEFIRTNSSHISDAFRTSVHLVSICYHLGQLAYHTSEIYKRLKLKI